MYRKFLLLLPILFLFTGCVSQKVQHSDKEFMVQATDLADYGYGFKKIRQHETFKKTRHLDGSLDLDYEFETPDSEQNEPLYMAVALTAQTKVSDALIVEGMEKLAGGAGLKWGDFKQKPVAGTRKYGQSSSLNVLMYQGTPAGNYFVCRQGKRTYSIMISGSFYTDDPEVWDELVGARVNKWLNAK